MPIVKVIASGRVKERRAEPGQTLLAVLTELGVPVAAPCGGKGVCGKCRVRIVSGGVGALPIYPEELEQIPRSEREAGFRLACQVRIYDDLTVEILQDEEKAAILTDDWGRKVELDPLVNKRYLALDKPSAADPLGDVERVERALTSPVRMDPALFAKVSEVLRAYDFKVTAALAEHEIIALEGGDTTGKSYGVAVDIGTTTMVCYLLDLVKGIQVDVASALNPQCKYGADVISRIDYTIENEDGLGVLSGLVRDEINRMVGELCQENGITAEDIYHVTVVGNTVMMHIFAGLPIKNLAATPYTPVTTRRMDFAAEEIGISINPRGKVTVLPMVASYVGADTIAAVLASGMLERDEISLLIDIGTNGEIVLGGCDRLIACSAAAGPAFEGARIECGMGGVQGAINTVSITDTVSYTTIADSPARGICGSGIVDAVAGMLKAGLVDSTGRIMSRDELQQANVPPAIMERIMDLDGRPAFLIAAQDEGAARDVYITQKDVREVQLAKAAIAAGIRILASEMGVELSEISHLYLAGGFGNYVNHRHAAMIGLIPLELVDRTVPIGNAAGAGAKMALLSRRYMARAEELRRQIRYVELSMRHDFQETFVECMGL